MSESPALVVDGLRVEVPSVGPIVEDVCFELARGEVLGLVGESGSGKTTVALALLGYARPGTRIAGGRILVAETEILSRDEATLRRLRSELVSYVPQDPATALNPALRIETQISEVLRAHGTGDRLDEAVASILQRVQLPSDREFRRRYPHQLSGGQQQRVALACALVCEPPVVVLDEPTTGLDVVTQAHVLDEIGRLRAEAGVSLVYISHDLAVVSSVADRVIVMYAGRVVEQGPTGEIVRRPRHPYAHGLVTSIPDHREPRHLAGIPGVAVGVGDRPPGCSFAPRCSLRVDRCTLELPPFESIGDDHGVRCFEHVRTPAVVFEPRATTAEREVRTPLLSVEGLSAEHASRGGDRVVAADHVSFSVTGGECVAIVGESGSGKTTIARCVVGLHAPLAGRILLDGSPLAPRARERSRIERRRVQIVFQNPIESLTPHHTVSESIAWPARQLRQLDTSSANGVVVHMLELVRIPGRLADAYPRDLSGGECQRVAIARALAAEPDLLVCDEVTSALDVSVQAAVLDLLGELQRQLKLAVLFITHDLGVVASIADRALVLGDGRLIEDGSVDDVLHRPRDEYTRRLIDAAPSLGESDGRLGVTAPGAQTRTVAR